MSTKIRRSGNIWNITWNKPPGCRDIRIRKSEWQRLNSFQKDCFEVTSLNSDRNSYSIFARSVCLKLENNIYCVWLNTHYIFFPKMNIFLHILQQMYKRTGSCHRFSHPYIFATKCRRSLIILIFCYTK